MSWIIEIRPFRGGWQCWEGDGVGPYWTGEKAQQESLIFLAKLVEADIPD